MESNNELELNYAEEFRVACIINNLRYEEVLQSFINSASFYVFIGGETNSACKWATKVITDCKQELNGKAVVTSGERIRQDSIKYVELLTELSKKEHLSIQTKAQKIAIVMKKWSKALASEIDFTHQVVVNSSYTLNLSFDFNMLCSTNGINTKQVLQYFINMISLAEDRALNLYEIVKLNPGTTFTLLLLIKDKPTKNRRFPQEHIYVKYGLQLMDLDETLEDQSELRFKVKAYRAFYLKWYNALRVIVN